MNTPHGKVRLLYPNAEAMEVECNEGVMIGQFELQHGGDTYSGGLCEGLYHGYVFTHEM